MPAGPGAVALLAVVALAVGGFLLGAANPAATLARLTGRDLRAGGSGNPGATNAARVLGLRWGVVVGVFDVLKAYVPTVVALAVGGLVPAAVVGTAVVLGHMFSPFLRFRGGKGVASALGVVLAVAPLLVVPLLAVFLPVALTTRFVGRGSVVACALLVVIGVLVGAGVLRGWAAFGLVPAEGWWVAALGCIVLARHHGNIRHWLRGV